MTRSAPATPGTVPEALAIQARLQPDAIAFVEVGQDGADRVLKYAETHDRIENLAARLVGAGVKGGDRVAVRLPKSVDALLLFFAVLRVGAIYVPINPDFTDREAGVLIEDSDPVLAIDNSEGGLPLSSGKVRQMQFGTGSDTDLCLQPQGALPEGPSAHDGAVMLFTSGTTGRPKGAPLTHANLLSNMLSLAEVWKITPHDRLLHVLPVFHAHGLFLGIVMPLAMGASVRVMAKFDAAETIRHLPGCTIFMAVPAIYTRLLDNPNFTPAVCGSLRLATSGSAPLSPEVFEALRTRMGLRVVERYGTTETSILATNPIDGGARVGSVGRPLSCVEMQIVGEDSTPLGQGEVGRVQVRGPSVLTSYWKRPDTSGDWTADGWFDTGDMGQMDEDGFLWLVGRKKDLIISGGFNVYPREIEIELETLDGVAEAVVFGVPHPDFGEGVVAAVRSEPGRKLDVSTLQSALGDGLAKYKRPKQIVVLDDFPRNQLGKVLKGDLRQTYADAFSVAR